MPQQLKVLISTYACSPYEGSEPGIGWNWVEQTAKSHEVWVFTLDYHKEDIEKEIKLNPMPNVHWYYFDSPWWMRIFERKSVQRWQKPSRFYFYYVWQITAYFLARKLHKQHHFDIAHHVSYGRYWMPSFLPFLPVPFIFGPVGGGDDTPKAFVQNLGMKSKLKEHIRVLMRGAAEFGPILRLGIRRTKVTIATTEATAKRLKRLGSKRVELLTHVAMESDVADELSQVAAPPEGTLRFISVGRMLHWKGFHLGLAAFARFVKTYPDSEYWFVGSGPEEDHLKQMAQEAGIEDKVRFFGNVTREEVLEHMADCHVLLHPSLHDSGGMVVTEAMAAGRPVICLNLGGPALQVVDGETGYKVEALSPEQTISAIEQDMVKLAENPELRRDMGVASRRRVQECLKWEHHAAAAQKIYAELAAPKS